jgi:WD40 repeat protein
VTELIPREIPSVRRCIPFLILLTCQPVGAQEPAAPPILVLDSGGHTSTVRKVLFTPDGKELISVSQDKTIRFWDVASGETLKVIRPPIGAGPEGELYTAALSPDGRLLAVGGWGAGRGVGWIYVLSTSSWRIERVLKGHTNVIRSLAFAPRQDGRNLLASGSADSTACLWDAASGRREKVLNEHHGQVAGVAFAPDGGRLVTASYDKTIRIWSAAEGRCERVLRGHEKEVRCVVWSPDGATLASGGSDRSIRLWRPDGSRSRTIDGLDNDVHSVAFTADSQGLLYSWGGPDAPGVGAAVVDVNSGRERVRFAGHDNTVFSGALSPDGSLAATAGGNASEVHIWKTSNAAPVHRLAGHGRPAWSVGWSADGKSIAWGNRNLKGSANNRGPLEYTFHLADLRRGQPPDARFHSAPETPEFVSKLHYQARLFDYGKGEAPVAKPQPDPSDDILCFTAVRGERGAAGTRSGNLLVFDPKSGRTLRRFEPHMGPIWSISASPDQRFLLTGSHDETLRIWDLDHDRPLLSLFLAGDDWVAWTPEGYYAASPGGEGLMGWHVSNGPEQVGTFVAAGQFHESLYRPAIISLLLPTGDVAGALKVFKEAEKSVRALLPPIVLITSPADSGIRLNAPELEVRAVATTQSDHPVTALKLMLDGRPYLGDKGRKPVGQDRASEKEVQERWNITLEPGKHQLAVVAESAVSFGKSGEIEVIFDKKVSAPPILYVLAVGISKYPDPLRLNYAAADALSLDAILRDKSAGLFERIETSVLIDKDATRQNIIGKLNWLRKKMRDQNVAIFFFSGHGATIDKTFYMISADADVKDLDSTAVTSGQFKEILSNIKGRLVVLLDACHSGAASVSLGPRLPTRRAGSLRLEIPVGRIDRDDSLRAPVRLLGYQREADGVLDRQLKPSTDDLVRDLSKYEHGIIAMSSSLKGEVSAESKALGHGYFTHALIEGISGQADSDKDGLVYYLELESYVSNRVMALTKEQQHPVSANPPFYPPFALSKPKP